MNTLCDAALLRACREAIHFELDEKFVEILANEIRRRNLTKVRETIFR